MKSRGKIRSFKIGDQIYEMVGVDDYWRDDRYIELHGYETICAHPGCNRVFRAAATKTAIKKRWVNRRCPRHKRPGSPVGDQKARAKKSVRKPPAKRAGRSALRVPSKVQKPPAPPSYLD